MTTAEYIYGFGFGVMSAAWVSTAVSPLVLFGIGALLAGGSVLYRVGR